MNLTLFGLFSFNFPYLFSLSSISFSFLSSAFSYFSLTVVAADIPHPGGDILYKKRLPCIKEGKRQLGLVQLAMGKDT
jgi:hypothetical protein